MRFIIDFPNPDEPGTFLDDPPFVNTREGAVSYLRQWFPAITEEQADLFITELEDEDESSDD